MHCLNHIVRIHKEDQAAASSVSSGGGGGPLQYGKISSLVDALEACSLGVPGGVLQALSDTVCYVLHPPPNARLP